MAHFFSTLTITDVSRIISALTLLGCLIWYCYKKKSEAFSELIHQKNLINDSIAKFKVKGPYALLSNINEDDLEKYAGLTAVYFNHLNLLNMVYRNRSLNRKVRKGYEQWITNIFGPWLQSNPWLCQRWAQTRDSKELFGADFIDWLDRHLSEMPI